MNIGNISVSKNGPGERAARTESSDAVLVPRPGLVADGDSVAISDEVRKRNVEQAQLTERALSSEPPARDLADVRQKLASGELSSPDALRVIAERVLEEL